MTLRKLGQLMVLGAGTLVTLAAASAGWCSLLSRLSPPVADYHPGGTIMLESTRLLYFKSDEVIVFRAEVRGARYIVHVPDQRRWAREMPHWCQNARGEVIADMMRLTARVPVDVLEYSDPPIAPDASRKNVSPGPRSEVNAGQVQELWTAVAPP